MHFTKLLRRWARALAPAMLAAALAGCATTHPTMVDATTEPDPNDGLVALRLVNTSGSIKLRELKVRSLTTGQEISLLAQQFGQTQTATFLGRLPAGRYQPTSLVGTENLMAEVTVPLDKAGDPFEVQARRVTDLRTLVFVPLIETDTRVDSKRPNWREWQTSFLISSHPTPVAVDALLKARLPKMAATMLAQPPLVGTIGTADKAALHQAVRRTRAAVNSRFVNDHLSMSGGPLGVVEIYDIKAGRRERIHMDTAHAIQAFEVLADGRLLVGGESGFLALNDPKRQTITPIQLLSPGDIVLLLQQASDGRVYLVADRESKVAVYRADPRSLTDWTLVRELPTEHSNESPAFDTRMFVLRDWRLPNFAEASNERLVVHTPPKQLHSMDLRTGQWETTTTQRAFRHGFKITPDGFIAGMWGPGWIATSNDYGRTWNRMSTWINATQPHFIDKQRGWVQVHSVGLMGSDKQHMQISQDGGQTWTQGPFTTPEKVSGGHTWLDPFWIDPTGKVMLRYSLGHYLETSTDGGAKWEIR
ncbi:MAG: hypothetical protein Q4G70_05625 [Pseudomonadota bacterium]|nr:hypothetical protein [Pseudomonadota bacterium]